MVSNPVVLSMIIHEVESLRNIQDNDGKLKWLITTANCVATYTGHVAIQTSMLIAHVNSMRQWHQGQMSNLGRVAKITIATIIRAMMTKYK